jgi:hypothetical protein
VTRSEERIPVVPVGRTDLAAVRAVGCGYADAASGNHSAAAAGHWNTASGGSAIIGGGYYSATADGSGTISGGWRNTADVGGTMSRGMVDRGTMHRYEDHNTTIFGPRPLSPSRPQTQG